MNYTLQRSDECIAEILDQYADMVLRMAMVYMKNIHDAEDVTQEVFVKLFEKSEQINNIKNVKAWLMRVTINKCKDMLKSSWKKAVDLDEESAIKIQDKGASDNMDFTRKELVSSIYKLPPNYRDVIYLHYYEGYKIDEIAKMLGRNENTVKTHLKRAREILKKELGEENE